MENKIRVTKAMRYADIRALLTGAVPANGSTIDDAVAFIDGEVALLAKKNAAKTSKQTAAQKENGVFRGLIIDFLQGQENGVTCTDILKGIPELEGYGNQKVAALLRPLLTEGTVTKATVKGKSLFSLS